MREQLDAAGRPGRVVDNHYVNNVVFGLLEPGRDVPEEAWTGIAQVWDVVLHTVERLSPPGWWFIVTNYLVEGTDDGWVERVAGACPQTLTFDITHLSPQAAAGRILAHAERR